MMDKRECLFRSIENHELKFIDCSFEERYSESWIAKYELRGTTYRFMVIVGRNISVSLLHSNLESKTLSERLELSKIAGFLMKRIKEFPRFKLKILLRETSVSLSHNKHWINDVEGFEFRKRSEFIQEHESFIRNAFHKSMNESKLKEENPYNDHQFLVIKEEDEIPLMDFLVENGYMTKIVVFNGESYLKPLSVFPFEHEAFFVRFKNQLDSIGYHLYHAEYTDDLSYGSFELNFAFAQEEDDYEDWYKKKKWK